MPVDDGADAAGLLGGAVPEWSGSHRVGRRGVQHCQPGPELGDVAVGVARFW